MKIKVMIKKPYEAPYEAEIENELETYQRIVGGYIETVPCPGESGTLLLCNEEGKLMNLEPNIFTGTDILCGTVIAVGVGEEDFTDLPKHKAERVWLTLSIRAMHRPEEIERATGYDIVPRG